MLRILLCLIFALSLVQCSRNSRNDLIIVPDLRGKPLSEALSDLKKLNLQGDFYEGGYYASIPQNYIVTQIPYPFTRVKKGRTVRLEVSKGKTNILMPSFVGMKFGEVNEKIIQLDLHIESITEVQGDEPPGTVLEQYPLEGQEVEMGSAIRLTISLPGIPMVPDWIGQHFEDVKYSIIEHGYLLGTVVFEENPFHPRGAVILQDPIPHSFAESGIRINLVINEKP